MVDVWGKQGLLLTPKQSYNQEYLAQVAACQSPLADRSKKIVPDMRASRGRMGYQVPFLAVVGG